MKNLSKSLPVDIIAAFLEICSGLQVSYIIEIRGSQLNKINIYTVAPQAKWVFGFSSTLGFQWFLGDLPFGGQE